jgi:hypothetical protein
LGDAGSVIVNLTGGTTALQHAVTRVGEESAELGRPTRRCALVDRRSREEQVANPWVAGEVVWLDAVGSLA